MRRFLLVLIVVFAASCLPDKTESKTDGITFAKEPVQIISQDAAKSATDLTVEIADTNEKRMHGLMYRTELADNEGMLFLFPVQKRISMWMANTPMSLDMLFINEQGKIQEIAENTVPFSHDEIYSEKKAAAVLEIKGGQAKSRNIKIGDTVKHPFFKLENR